MKTVIASAFALALIAMPMAASAAVCKGPAAACKGSSYNPSAQYVPVQYQFSQPVIYQQPQVYAPTTYSYAPQTYQTYSTYYSYPTYSRSYQPYSYSYNEYYGSYQEYWEESWHNDDYDYDCSLYHRCY